MHTGTELVVWCSFLRLGGSSFQSPLFQGTESERDPAYGPEGKLHNPEAVSFKSDAV